MCRTSGFITRWTIHGTTAHDARPGTIAAMNQLDQVTCTLTSFAARLAPRMLLAWPVKNIAQATADPWYMLAMRKPPMRDDVGPGCESKSSAMRTATGMTMPALRAVIEGTPEASVTSVAISAYETPSELRPKARMKISAMRRARPLSSIDRAISIATITSHTDGSAKPPSTSRIGVPLAAIAVSPRRTSAEAGSGSITMPAMTQAKIAARRQPCGVTASAAAR